MNAREARGRGRPHTWPSLGVALALLALVLAGCGPSARPAATHAPTRTAATAPGVIRLGPTDPARTVDITLLLEGQQPQLLAQTLAAIGDPASPLYRHFLTPAQYAQQFGASPAAEAQVRRALGAAGLAVTGRSSDGLMLHARGTVGQVAALFGVDFADYRGPDGRTFYSATTAPHVPAALRLVVRGVLGLDDQAVVKPRRLARPASGTNAGLIPSQLLGAYGLTALANQGLDGSGLTVALAEIDTFKQSDIDTYDQQFQAHTQPVDVVNVDGGAQQATDGSETTLDIEVLHAIAPGAHIIAYEGQATLQGLVDIFNQAVTASPAQVVSISLGVCEALVLHPQQAPQEIQGLFDEPGTTFLAALDTTFKQAGAQGTSVLVSSGDTGAYDCSHLDPANHALSTTLPASNPYVTAVGGTALFLGSDNVSYGHEAGWEDPLEEAGGGGGVSQAYQKPLWQTGPGTTTAGSDGMRQVPDVAANADPLTGYAVYDSSSAGSQNGCDPQSTGDNSCWTVVGGTSAAAPLWASVTLLADQAAAAAKQGPVGFLNPALYALAAKSGGSPDFHDVTVGGNLYYQAGPGWDFSTGLGTPVGDTLVPDLVRLGATSG